MKSSKVSSYVITVGFTLIMLFSSTMIQSVDLITLQKAESHDGYSKKVQIAYIDRELINITSNAIFSTYGFPGNGSPANPYIIENYNITRNGNCISIYDTDAYFIIQDCLLTGEGLGSGVFTENVTNGVVRNNNITLKDHPVYIRNSQEILIENNTLWGNNGVFLYSSSWNEVNNNSISIYGGHSGVYLAGSSHNTLVNNTISENYYPSISIANSPDNTISGNKMGNIGLELWGSEVEDWRQNITANNYVNEQRVGYFWSMIGGTTDWSQYGSVILANCTDVIVEDSEFNYISTAFSSNCTIANNNISDNSQLGVQLAFSTNNTIMNNIISGNRLGVYLYASSENLFEGNNISLNDDDGVILRQSFSNKFENNTIEDNSDYGVNFQESSYNNELTNNTIIGNERGVQLYNSHSNKVVNNTISNNEDGVHIYAYGNEVVNNTIMDNDENGVRFSYFCYSNVAVGNYISGSAKGVSLGTQTNHNTVEDNIIKDNEYGVRIESLSNHNRVENNTITGSSLWGIYCRSTTHDNIMFHNSFADNGGRDASDDGTENLWNTTAIGNYWSNYAGTGPYYIPGSAGSIDYHPYGYSETVLPEINHPDDVEYDEGTVGHDITWSFTESHPSHYVIYQNSTKVEVGDWDGGNITINIDGLVPGVYNYTILVYDLYNNWVSDYVIVTVIAGDAFALVEVLLIGGGVGVVLVVLVLIRKRS